MKSIRSIILLAGMFISLQWLHAQTPAIPDQAGVPVPTAYQVVESGENHNVWQRETYEKLPNGTIVSHLHQFTELTTGLNFTNANGQLEPASEQITLLPQGGGVAVRGQHQVYFPADIYNGVIDMITPDGRELRSRPLGVSYDDGTNTVLIATLTNSVGWLTSSNQVTYPNAFAGLKADLVCTYRKSGFECDLVFRQSPPMPAQFGLSNARSTVQLVTEFFNTADPQSLPGQTNAKFGLQDSTLQFGRMTMTQGKAFAVGDGGGQTNLLGRLKSGMTSVYKRWIHTGGRTFLIEEVPLVRLTNDLAALPLTASAASPGGQRLMASGHREFPAAHGLLADTNQILLATADLDRSPGVVLDYVAVNSGGNYTFSAGTTYYVSGQCYFNNVTLNGGAVIKYANVNSATASVEVDGTLTCNTSADAPAIFTAADDDTVGDTIYYSTGSPSGNFYANPAIYAPGSVSLSNVRISYAEQAVWVAGSGSRLALSDSQVYDCQAMAVLGSGGYGSGLTLTCNNFRCDAPYYGIFVYDNGGGGNSYGLTNCTLNNVYYLVAGQNYYYANQGNAVNCVFASGYMNVTGYCTWSGSHNGFYYAGTPFGSSTTNIMSNPFQTWSGNNFYLTSGSAFRNIGTTAISSTLLADLQARTTFAPQAGGYLDKDTPDLGYHYYPTPLMVVGWGDDYFGESDVALGITNALMVAGSYAYSLAVLNDGTVAGWGYSYIDGWVPTNLVGVAMVACGWNHNVALLTNGTVTAWGTNYDGALNVPSNLTNATVISAQTLHTLALRSNGTVVGWGDDLDGQIDVPAGLTNVIAIAAGGAHSLAVSNGFVVAWGWNGYGQTNVPAGLSNVQGVAAGWAHSVALKKDGTVVCWGDNNYGESTVPAGLSNVVAIAAGGDPFTGEDSAYTLALKSDGKVVAWGDSQVVSPLQGLSNVVAIGGGANYGLAIRTGPPTPVITLEPTNQYQAQDSNVTFIARGAGLYGVTYQWQYTNVNISGATGALLTLTNVQPSQNGAYHVVVTDNGGMGSLVSSNASLTVVTPPVFTYQSSPTNIVTIYGKNISLSGTANAPGTTNGFPISYHWQLNGTNITGATTSAYSFFINDTNAGLYTLVAQNAAGSASVSWQTALTNAIDVTQDLLLIYNTNSVDSTTVLNYYLAHRPNVSGANVLGIGYTNPVTPGYFETITPTELTNQIFNPIYSWLTNNPAKRPQYVILFMDLPSRVDFTSAYPTNGYPYYHYPQPSSPNDVSVQLHSLISGWQPYVTHLNMGMNATTNRTNDCIAYINKLAAIGVPIASNSPVLSASAGGYGNTNFVLDDVRFGVPGTNSTEDFTIYGGNISAVTNVLIANGISPSAVQFYDAVLTNGFFNTNGNYWIWTYLKNGSVVNVTNAFLTFDATNAMNVAGYVSWGVHGNISVLQTLDGSLTWHGHSGWWLINTEESWNGTQVVGLQSQGSFVYWFSSTAFGGTNYCNTPIGAVTTVYEPYLAGKNDNSTYFGLWSLGKNFGICAWNSKNSPYFQATGDPLITK